MKTQEEEDVKPTIRSDGQSGIKPKHSRYEDVWPADVHAAFMEAIALYPPMGKRRLKYYRVSARTHPGEASPDSAQVKSFGRCQLIQSYILEKTGKNRSRKQVSSHLQRLKKIHKDNPAMRALFSETSQSLSDNPTVAQTDTKVTNSQDIADLPLRATPLKSEFDHHPAATHNIQKMPTGLNRASSFSYDQETSSSISGVSKRLEPSANFCGHPPFILSQENISESLQECQAGAPHAPDGDSLLEYDEPALFKDGIGATFQPSSNHNTSTFPMSMRRLVSKLPVIGRQLDLPPSYQSRTMHAPGFQPAHRISSRDSLNYPSLDISSSYNLLVSPNEQVYYTPLHPVQAFHPDRRLLGQDPESDWAWPQDSDVPFPPFVAPLSRGNTFSEIRLQYPLSMYQLNPLCPETRVRTPESYIFPSESDGSMLSRRLSYSTVTSPPSLSQTTSTRAPISLPEHDVPRSSEYLASPLVVKPTPLYPISYLHSDDRASPLSEYQAAAFHDNLMAQTLRPCFQQ